MFRGLLRHCPRLLDWHKGTRGVQRSCYVQTRRKLRWIDTEGTEQEEIFSERDSRHPLEIFTRAEETLGARKLRPRDALALGAQCLTRLHILGLCEGARTDAPDTTHEVVKSMRFFDAVVRDPDAVLAASDSVVTREYVVTALRQLSIKYLCKAGLPKKALKRQQQLGLLMNLGMHAAFLECINGGLKPNRYGLKWPEFVPEVVYEALVRGLDEGIVDTSYNALGATHAICLVMLSRAAVLQSEANAFAFFKLFRTILHQEKTKFSLVKGIEVGLPVFPRWRDTSETLASFTTKQPLSDIFGPRLPKCNPQLFTSLINSCVTIETAVLVVREAAEQESVTATVCESFIHLCKSKNEYYQAAWFMKEIVSQPGVASPHIQDAWITFIAYTRQDAPEHIRTSVESYTSIVDAMVMANTKLKPHTGAQYLVREIALACRGIPPPAGPARSGSRELLVKRIETIAGRGGVPAGVRKMLDEIRLVRKDVVGVDLGETAELPPKDQERNAATWEKAATLSHIADAGASASPTEPWRRALDEVARNFKSSVILFRYTFGGVIRVHKGSVVGPHPAVDCVATIDQLGGTDEMVQLFWGSAGDAGVSVMLQVCRLRLMYAMSVTVLGGFRDVFLKEVSQTQSLFQQAGSEGAVGKWSWKAMRMFEDEADSIAETRSVFAQSSVVLYTRLTKK